VKVVNLDGINPAQQTSARRSEAIQAKSADQPKPSVTANGSDHISLSGLGVQVEKMVTQAQGIDGVRQERVESLRQLVASGEYHVPASRIAEAIMSEENG
jgi:flagellar biosynthesis anti-sigma factor FlgM